MPNLLIPPIMATITPLLLRDNCVYGQKVTIINENSPPIRL